MMEKTAYQKIIKRHLVEVLPGGNMALTLDWVWGHEITGPNGILDAQERGIDIVFDPNRVKMMIDHVSPAKDTDSAIQGKIVRDWSKKHNSEFLDVGRNGSGICHAVIPDNGWIFPGQIGIMGDSHTCTHGAFGALTAGVGTTEWECGIIYGLWICPPQKVIRVNFNGILPKNVFAKDLILTLINKIGVKGATNAVLEFGGNVIDEMSVEGRMTITNPSIEAGATSGMMRIDEKTIEYLWLALRQRFSSGEDALKKLSYWNSEPDAKYDQIINIDVDGLKPVITQNYSPADVVRVSELVGKPVNQVFIGSCTNGRISDLRIAASIIRMMGGKISDNLRCIVIPATQRIYQQALKEGLIETFIRAGCFVSGPTCGPCLGMSCGVLAPGEVCVSTSNRNGEGRMGKGGMVHLTSPATAALTAINGEITEPSIDLCRVAVLEQGCAPYYFAVQPTGWKGKKVPRPDYSRYTDIACVPKHKEFSGKVFYLPLKNVNTDHIIPAKYLNIVDKKAMGRYCLEDAPIAPETRQQMYGCQIMVTDENFGCGSSREHAPWALEGVGIKCVIAPSFARIFESSMFAIGLLCVTLRKEVIDRLFEERPDYLFVHWQEGSVQWGEQSNVSFNLSDYQKDLIRSGGLVGVMLKLAVRLQQQGKI